MKIRFRNTKFVVIVSLLGSINFLALTFLKYDLNNLPFVTYRIDYIGNTLNILICLVLLSGFVGLGFCKKTITNPRSNLLLALQVVGILALIIIYIVSKIIPFSYSSYLFSFPIKKVLVGILFITNILCQIYSLIFVWGLIIGLEKLYEVRTLVRTIFAIFILIIFSLFYVWNANKYFSEKLSQETYQYGVIPGAAVWSKSQPSPIFEGRIRKALELYRKGIVKNLVLTGGNAPGELSEAEAAFNYLTNLGVKIDNLMIERNTSTTAEQIKFLKFNLLIADQNSKVLIISDSFHISRILQMCKFFRVNAIGISSDHILSFEKTLFYRTRESIALLLFWFFAI